MAENRFRLLGIFAIIFLNLIEYIRRTLILNLII